VYRVQACKVTSYHKRIHKRIIYLFNGKLKKVFIWRNLGSVCVTFQITHLLKEEMSGSLLTFSRLQ